MSGTTDQGLGRLFAPDHRDLAYPLRAAAPGKRRTKYWPLMAHWLDQGATGTCVGHGWRHLLTGLPQPRRNPLPSAFDIYDHAILVDEWTDNDRDPQRQFGTSVRAGAKVLQDMNLINAYGWAFDLDSLVDWICWHGPVVAGTNWYNSMFDRDKGGFLRIPAGARIAGGHCTLWLGWDERRGAVRGLTSWNSFGYFWLTGEDAARLLHEDGEACSPTEVPKG